MTQGKVNLYYGQIISYCVIAVPVVVLFTKCDALLATAIGKLNPEEKKLPQEEQLSKMREYVKEMMEKNPAWEMLITKTYPPKYYVHLESKYCDLGGYNLGHFLLYRHA